VRTLVFIHGKAEIGTVHGATEDWIAWRPRVIEARERLAAQGQETKVPFEGKLYLMEEQAIVQIEGRGGGKVWFWKLRGTL